MPYVSLHKKGYLVTNGYDYRSVLKKLGGKWLPEQRAWLLPFSADLLELTQYSDVTLNEEALRYFKETWERKHALKQLHFATDAQVKYPDGLDPYQRVGVRFLADAGRAILADDVGLGKTSQSIRAAMEVEAKRVLVVAKKSLIYNWVAEIKRWAGKEAFVLTTQNLLPLLSEWVVTNYEVVVKRLYELEAVGFDVLIVDEAAAIKNRKAQRSKAVHKLAKGIPYVWLLTATPMPNSPDEIWSLLHCIRPEEYSSYWRFVEEHLDWGYNFFGDREIYGIKNPTAFTEELAPLMLRRDKSLLRLPPVSYETVHVTLESEQHRIYRDLRHKFLAVLDEEHIVTAPSVLAQITRLRQVTCSPALVGGVDISSKTNALLDILEDLTPNHKVLVFTTFAEYVKLLLPNLEQFGAVAITGDTSTVERAEVIKKFNEDPSTRVFVGTVQAAGEGLNLQAADIVIFLNKSWTPSENEVQAIGRAHRRGQTKPVHVINIIAARTIDEYIEEVLQQKMKSTEVVQHLAERLKREVD